MFLNILFQLVFIWFKVTKICLNLTWIFDQIWAVFNPISDVTNHLVELIFFILHFSRSTHLILLICESDTDMSSCEKVCCLCSPVQLEKSFKLKLNIEIVKSNSVIWEYESLSAGNRAAEERRATMGQKVEVDEHEGGVRSPVLSSLAQSVRHAGSREGQSLPVRGVRRRSIEHNLPLLSLHKHLFLLFTSVYSWRSVSERSHGTETLATRF